MDYEKMIRKLKDEKSSLVKFDLDTDEYWFSQTLIDYLDELLGFPSKDYMEEFISCIVADLKMMLLKEAVISINNFYRLKRNWSFESGFGDSVYYTNEEFREKIGDFTKINGMVEDETIFWNTINKKEYDQLHKRIPRITFPWFAFSLCQFYMDLNLDTQKNKLYVVYESTHALKNLENNLLPTPKGENHINDAQRKLDLIKRVLADTDMDVNKSLSIFLFNNATNLLDLHTYVSKFTRLYSERYSYQTVNMDEKDLLKFIDSEIKDISMVSMVKGYYVRHFLIHNIKEKFNLKSERTIWSRFNEIIELLKGHLRSDLEKKYKSSLDCEREEIYFIKHLYDVLKDDEPYLDSIDRICRKKHRTYVPISNYQPKGLHERQMHSLFLATYCSYKHIYNNIFFEDKRKHPFERY